MVSLSVKYDIVRSDIQENTPVLNLQVFRAENLVYAYSIKLTSTRKFRTANNQF